MRILIYGLNYEPELTGVGKYTGEMVNWLAGRGHEIKVITAPPYYPEWNIWPTYTGAWYKKERSKNRVGKSAGAGDLAYGIGSVTIWRCPMWVPSKPSGLKRILHLVSFALSSFPIILSQVFWRPNIILVVEPPLFCAPTTLFVSWLCKASSWLHVQDFEVDAAFDLGVLSSSRLHRIMSKVESWLMNKFDRVSTISDQMIVRLGAKGVPPERQVLLPNWVDVDHISPIKDKSIFREELNISPDQIVFLYSGNMGEKQGLEIIIESAQRLNGHKNVVFVMCGRGAAYSRLRDQANGLENIHWLPLQPLDRLNELLNLADVHLLPQRSDVADLVMPSKLTGMLASGRPILATALDGSEVAKVLEKTGVTVSPGEVDAFVAELIRLAENEEERVQLGKAARSYAEKNLDMEAVLVIFEEELRKCVNDGKYILVSMYFILLFTGKVQINATASKINPKIPSPPLSNIAATASNTNPTHNDAIKNLLARHGLSSRSTTLIFISTPTT